MNKVMIISPHHDDEVIGCGGAIYNHKQNGDQVTVVFMMAGWSGIYWEADQTTAAGIIQQEAREAAKCLGVYSVKELNLEDRNLSFSKSALLSLIRAIREESPEIIYLPHAFDGDREHRLVYEIAREAIWLAASSYLPEAGKMIPTIKTILGYEVWRPMTSYQLALDITDAVAAKSAALNCYKSQLQVKNWVDAAIGLNRFRGVTSGEGEYVEVFQIIKIDRKSI